jgi:putative tryptophan/tyrosine transport system substrate-binding protein
MKKPALWAIALVLVAAVAAAIWLSNLKTPETTPQKADIPRAGDGRVVKICVAQYVDHPLLDAVYKGFRQELSRHSDPITNIEFSNANGDATAASLLADKVCKNDCAVILALATPMAQDVKTACPATQPILFGAITDPKSAGLVASMTSPGGNLTGTSDQWPYALQMELIAHLWGKNAEVGVPFNPGEANTQYAMEQIRTIAKKIGLRLHEVPINSVTEASQAIDALANKVAVIYVPADNTAVAAAPGIVAAADRLKLPVVAGDPGTFKAGAVVGLGVDYTNLGVINAKQAFSIIGGMSPATIPIGISSRPELYVDEKRASRFSLDIAELRSWYATVQGGSS